MSRFCQEFLQRSLPSMSDNAALSEASSKHTKDFSGSVDHDKHPPGCSVSMHDLLVGESRLREGSQAEQV